MMNARACLAASAFVLAAACTGANGPPPQGSWICTADAMGAKTTVDVAYAAGGASSGTATVAVDQPGAKIDIKVGFKGKWALDKDQLSEEMTDTTIESATMNGQPVPDELKDQMTSGMKAPQTSTMKVEGDTMTLSAGGMATTCKKK